MEIILLGIGLPPLMFACLTLHWMNANLQEIIVLLCRMVDNQEGKKL